MQRPIPNTEIKPDETCDQVPVVDAFERLFEPAQDFRGCGPLHMPAVVLHGSHISEAPVDLTDVGLHLIAPVGPQNDERCPHSSVTHSGYGSSPHLHTERHGNTDVQTRNKHTAQEEASESPYCFVAFLSPLEMYINVYIYV